jgi:hypothetical protein
MLMNLVIGWQADWGNDSQRDLPGLSSVSSDLIAYEALCSPPGNHQITRLSNYPIHDRAQFLIVPNS